jgi:hypothetical protein
LPRFFSFSTARRFGSPSFFIFSRKISGESLFFGGKTVILKAAKSGRGDASGSVSPLFFVKTVFIVSI